MRKLLALAALTAVAVLVGMASPAGAGSSEGTLASGSFTILGPAFGLPAGSNRTFAFSVNQISDGTVTGQMQVRSFNTAILHGTVNCFVQAGNQAIVGGIVTADSLFSGAVGTAFGFAIQDNPDVSTFLLFGYSPPACDNFLAGFGEPDLPSVLIDDGIPITTGNITIHQAG
jgi:hypothetical protein